MRKIIGFFTLIFLLVASNMHLIHAMDMKDMSMQGNHIMQSDESIFCDTSSQKSSECTKEIFPDKLFQKQEKLDLDKNILVNYLNFFGKNSDIIIFSNINQNQENKSIPIIQKSSYQKLVGIIKNLN